MNTSRAVAVDGSLGSYPYVNTGLLATLVPVLGVRPQGSMPTPRMIYTAVIGNPSAAFGYLQIVPPTVSGNIAGQASLNTPGAQAGVVVTLPPSSVALVSGNTYLLDIRSNAEAVVVTVTAGPTLNATDSSNSYTVSFTSTKAHATVGPIALMGWLTAPSVALGTANALPIQSYPIASGQGLVLLFGDMGQAYPLGFAIAATTLPAGAVSPATAMIVNLGVA